MKPQHTIDVKNIYHCLLMDKLFQYCCNIDLTLLTV